jgi:hypothetical protein
MTKVQLKEIMNRHLIVDCEIEDVIYFVQDLLDFQAEEIKKTEPYATSSIRRLEESALEVGDLLEYLQNENGNFIWEE